MSKRLLALLAGFIAVAIISLGNPQASSAITPDIVVDHNNITPCIPGHTTYTSIHEAVDAVSSPGTKIFVCAGTYSEPTLRIDVTSETLFGPGSTPENDGVAVITKDPGDANSYMVYVTADSTYFQGFAIDATPPIGFQAQVLAVTSIGNYNEIDDNLIVNAHFAPAIYVGGTGPVVQRNHLTNDEGGIMCECMYGTYTDNVIDATVENLGIQAVGAGQNLQTNQLTGTGIRVDGPGSTINGNTIDFAGSSDYAMIAAGDPLTVSNNTVKNSMGVAMDVTDPNSVGNTVATVTNNIFQDDSGVALYLNDNDGQDTRTVSATVSGAPAYANIFTNVTGSLLQNFTASDIDAEYNNWGLCSLQAIEGVIYHHPDDAQFGTVDYDPFIDPGNCPTPTPTHSPTPTRSATPTPSPSPTGTPLASHEQGDLDCSGHIDGRDALMPVRSATGLPVTTPGGCPALDSGSPKFGDVTCDGSIGAPDTIAILQHAADVPIIPSQPTGCTPIGALLS